MGSSSRSAASSAGPGAAFAVVTAGGRWILKPDNPAYPEAPANEDLAMRLAAAAGVRTADHALVYARAAGRSSRFSRGTRACTPRASRS